MPIMISCPRKPRKLGPSIRDVHGFVCNTLSHNNINVGTSGLSYHVGYLTIRPNIDNVVLIIQLITATIPVMSNMPIYNKLHVLATCPMRDLVQTFYLYLSSTNNPKLKGLLFHCLLMQTCLALKIGGVRLKSFLSHENSPYPPKWLMDTHTHTHDHNYAFWIREINKTSSTLAPLNYCYCNIVNSRIQVLF